MSVFDKVQGSGERWIRYADQYGHIHREKVGPKSLAQKAYEKRKTDIREGKFFPEKLSQRPRPPSEATVNRHLALLSGPAG